MVIVSRFLIALLWVLPHCGHTIHLGPEAKSTQDCTEFKNKLCVDFGSSGAKFSDCVGASKKPKFPGNAAGAFARTAAMDPAELKADLEKYLADHKLPRDKATTCVEVCGGTAGNRFKDLYEDDEASWGKFNLALGNFATFPQNSTSRKPKNCRTFSGTEEAAFEWAFTKSSPLFVGIGGASMQLHLPIGAGKECPPLMEKVHFQGGAGANKRGDFCETTSKPDGMLWSLLADRKFNKNGEDKRHIFGGMNEVAQRYYRILKYEKLLTEANIHLRKLAWAKEVIRVTALSDPMWKALLQSFHGVEGGCVDLPGSDEIVFLANPDLGRIHLNHGWVTMLVREALRRAIKQAKGSALSGGQRSLSHMRSLVGPRRLSTSSDLLHHVVRQMSSHARFNEVAEDVATACLQAVTEAKPLRGSQGKEFFAEFDDQNPKKSGFLCTVKMFTVSWLATLAGYAEDTTERTDTQKKCFNMNFEKLLSAKGMSGDWMSGALASSKAAA